MDFFKWLGSNVFNVAVGDWVAGDGEPRGTVELQVGKTVFHSVPARMRTELWLSRLARGSGAAAAQQYASLLKQGVSEEVLAEIDKDTHRTFPGHPRLGTEEGQHAMRCVLAAYAASDPRIGYTQGMNFLAGLLLTYIDSEAEAFGALYMLMHDRGLRELYLPDMTHLQVRLWQLGRLLPSRLAAHLEAHAVLPVLYASSWLLTCYASDFPLSFAARVLDLVITDCWAAPMMKVAVGILTRCEALLLEMDDFEVMVDLIRSEVPRWPRVTLQELLTEALSQPWTKRQLRVLEQMNGAETVVEAVQRVQGMRTTTTEAAELAPSSALSSDLASSACSGSLSLAATESLRAAADAAAAAGAAAADAGAAGPGGPPGQQLQQVTPRTAAACAAVLKLNPLPPPPSSRAEEVAWGEWQATQTHELQSMPTASVRIELDIGDHLLDLEEPLSQALSDYASGQASLDSDGSAQAAAAAAPPAATTTVGAEGREAAAGRGPGAARQRLAAPELALLVVPSSSAGDCITAAAAEGSRSIGRQPADTGKTPPAGQPPPSPFESSPRQDSGKAPVHARRLSAAADLFGSFTGATSDTALLQAAAAQPAQQRAGVAEPPAAAEAAAPASPLRSFLNLFSRASPGILDHSASTSAAAAPGSQSSLQHGGGSHELSAATLQLEGLRVTRGGVQAQQPLSSADFGPDGELDQWSSWKTATETSPDKSTCSASTAPASGSADLASTASGGAGLASAHLHSSGGSSLASLSPKLSAAQAGERAAQLLRVHADNLALLGSKEGK